VLCVQCVRTWNLTDNVPDSMPGEIHNPPYLVSGRLDLPVEVICIGDRPVAGMR
jgi:hypothetical protein